MLPIQHVYLTYIVANNVFYIVICVASLSTAGLAKDCRLGLRHHFYYVSMSHLKSKTSFGLLTKNYTGQVGYSFVNSQN